MQATDDANATQNRKPRPAGFWSAFRSSFAWLLAVSVIGLEVLGLCFLWHAMLAFTWTLAVLQPVSLLLPPAMALLHPGHRTGRGLLGILAGMVLGLLVEGVVFFLMLAYLRA